jgi:hypothetical protein
MPPASTSPASPTLTRDCRALRGIGVVFTRTSRMFRRVTAAVVALLAAASLALVAVPAAAAPATTNTNAPAYWQTPGTSEQCDSIEPGGTSYTLPAPPANSVWTKVVVKAGNAPSSVTHENNAYYSNATYYYNSAAPYTQWNQVANLATTTFVPASDKEISHVIRCWAPAPATPVAGGAATTNQSCLNDALLGGVITVEIKAGVTYTITGPSGAVAFDAITGQTAPQAPGSYTVGVAATAGYALTGPASIPLTVLPYGDDCGVDDIEVAGGAATTNETCVQDALVGGVITVEIRTGVEYTITGPSGAVAFDAVTGMTAPLPPGAYTVDVTATTGYTLTSAASIPLTVAPYGDDCGVRDIVVTPSASVVDETCQNDVLLVGGSITVGPDYGITYTITGPSGAVAFDALTRTTGELPPGVYTVTPAAKPGFVLSSAAPLIREVLEYGDDCGLTTFASVAPTAVQTQLTCFGNATYTLSDDQPGLAATIWTVNGAPAANGVFPVSADGVYNVHAEPAVGFTFTFGQQTDWEFTFTRPTDCDLTTLALTGSDGASGSAWYAALAAGLGLLGAGLIRRAGRAGRAAA